MKDIIFGKIEIKAFGGIKNRVFDLKPGVNTVVAENGAGKSTLAAFIKFIMYGFSGTRLAGIIGNERNMYIPWDSNFVDGSINLSCSKGEFNVARYYCKPAKETVTITDRSTGRQVLNGVVPGEYFFGLTEETFVKTAFFYSLQKTKNGDPALAQQLENLVFSADELMSYQSSADKLNNARTSIINRQNRGILPDARAKLTAVENDLYTATAANDEITALTQSLRQKKQLADKRRESLNALGEELDNIEKYEAKKRLDRLVAAKDACEAAKRELETAQAGLGGEIPDAAFVERLTAERNMLATVTERLETKRADIEETEREIDKKRHSSRLAESGCDASRVSEALKKRSSAVTVFAVMTLVLAIAFGVLAALVYIVKTPIEPMISFAVLGLCAVAVVGLVVALAARGAFAKKHGYSSVRDLKSDLKNLPGIEFALREKTAELERRREDESSLEEEENRLTASISEKIEKCTGESVPCEMFGKAITEIVDCTSGALLIKNDYLTKKSVYDFTADGADEQQLALLAEGAEEPARRKEDVQRDISFISTQIEGLNIQCHEAEKRIAQLREHPHEPSALEAQRKTLQTRIESLEDKKNAYELAIQMLEKASTYMRSSISPQLTAYATEYFCEASNFSYKSLGIDTNLNLSFGLDEAEHNADYLSDGTRDTAYLCVRFALLKMICKNGRPPVVLDDAFGHLDRNRLHAMLSVITNSMEGGQTLILTCRGDELEFFSQKGTELNMLELK